MNMVHVGIRLRPRLTEHSYVHILGACPLMSWLLWFGPQPISIIRHMMHGRYH